MPQSGRHVQRSFLMAPPICVTTQFDSKEEVRSRPRPPPAAFGAPLVPPGAWDRWQGSSDADIMKKGVPVSPGVAVAHAYCLDPALKQHDSYLQERIADLRDVVGRIQAWLAHEEKRPALDVTEPVILVASEILPSQAFTFDAKLVAGLLTETGATTGHAAILARALGIPAVS